MENMQAYRLNGFGSVDHLAQVEDERPVAGRGEVLVRVRAASLNYRTSPWRWAGTRWSTRAGWSR